MELVRKKVVLVGPAVVVVGEAKNFSEIPTFWLKRQLFFAKPIAFGFWNTVLVAVLWHLNQRFRSMISYNIDQCCAEWERGFFNAENRTQQTNKESLRRN